MGWSVLGLTYRQQQLGHFCLNPKFFLAGLHTKCQDKTGKIVHRKKLNAISFSVTFILCMLAGPWRVWESLGHTSWGFQGHSSNENRTHPSSSITKVTQASDLKPHLSYDLISEFSFITSTAHSVCFKVIIYFLNGAVKTTQACMGCVVCMLLIMFYIWQKLITAKWIKSKSSRKNNSLRVVFVSIIHNLLYRTSNLLSQTESYLFINFICVGSNSDFKFYS